MKFIVMPREVFFGFLFSKDFYLPIIFYPVSSILS